MSDLSLVIPVVGELTKGEAGGGWVKQEDRVFFTVRFFLNCRHRYTGAPLKMGSIGLSLGTAKDVTTSTTENFEVQIVKKNTQNTFEEFFAGSEELSNASAGLTLDVLKAAPISPKFNLSASISDKLSKSFRRTTTIIQEYTETLTHKIELKYDVSPKAKGKYVVPLMYQEYAYDIFVSRIDYIIVAYERSGIQIRYRRKKYPDASVSSSRKTHQNIVSLNHSLCCVKSHELLTASNVIEESEYRLEVERPDEFIVGPPERTNAGAFTIPKKYPTLYQIAEQAFPEKRW